MPSFRRDASVHDWREGMFADPAIGASFLPDGEIRLRSLTSRSPRARTVLDWLLRWAGETPETPFVTEVVGGREARRALSYGQAWTDAERIGAGLLASGLAPGDRLMVVAPNGIGHMRLALAAFRTGIVYVPVAPQYVAAGADAGKLAGVMEMIGPSAIYCDRATDAPLLPADLQIMEGEAALDALAIAGDPRDLPDLTSIDPEAPAKLLLTSGSTGMPKAVPYSHTLMADNLQGSLDVWRFMNGAKPVLVDWLPWNHAFGGSNNVHLVLSRGGTLHIDPSRGRPERLSLSIDALRTLRPTFHGAVPAGWAALLPVIEADADFREAFFGRLDAMFSAGASMSADLFDRLSRASSAVRGRPVPIVTGWGATETGPGATLVHDLDARPGWIGTPLPGTEVRLVPSGGKLEMRVRGPSVMRGYWNRDDLTENAFDEEGFFRSGDAGRMVDPSRPELGLLFDGRLLDDFKLANGSWVNASNLRLSLLQRAGGAVRDLVIVGADRSHVGALCWTDDPSCLARIFDAHNIEHLGQTMRIATFAALATPPTEQAGELTLKGEINRRALIARRPEAVAALYREQGA